MVAAGGDTMERMRRILASLLAGLFSFLLIAPALSASDPDANLPACCRRDGKHHCAMMMRLESRSGPGFQADRCPFFPSVNAVPASPTAGLPGIARMIFVGPFSHSTAVWQVGARSRISYSQAGQKRGPPSLFS